MKEDIMKRVSFENCRSLSRELKRLLPKNGADLIGLLENSESLESKSHDNVPTQTDVDNILDKWHFTNFGFGRF